MRFGRGTVQELSSRERDSETDRESLPYLTNLSSASPLRVWANPRPKELVGLGLGNPNRRRGSIPSADVAVRRRDLPTYVSVSEDTPDPPFPVSLENRGETRTSTGTRTFVEDPTHTQDLW